MLTISEERLVHHYQRLLLTSLVMMVLSSVIHCVDLQFKGWAKLPPQIYVRATCWYSQGFKEKLKF